MVMRKQTFACFFGTIGIFYSRLVCLIVAALFYGVIVLLGTDSIMMNKNNVFFLTMHFLRVFCGGIPPLWFLL